MGPTLVVIITAISTLSMFLYLAGLSFTITYMVHRYREPIPVLAVLWPLFWLCAGVDAIVGGHLRHAGRVVMRPCVWLHSRPTVWGAQLAVWAEERDAQRKRAAALPRADVVTMPARRVDP